MAIIIGCSPSTGSSLLRQMLNRHPKIYCGPETALFSHPKLFEDWSKYKNGLYKKPLITAPDIHLQRGVTLHGPETKWSRGEILNLIASSGTLDEFITRYFERPLKFNNKQLWAEKTPSNVLTFGNFRSLQDDGHLVHIVRNPLDAIASLIRRGYSTYMAVARYLFNTSHGMHESGEQWYHLVRYEELVTNPAGALQDLLSTFDLEYVEDMAEGGKNTEMSEPERMKGWHLAETAAPSTRSVGAFGELPPQARDLVLGAIETIRLGDRYCKHADLGYSTVAELSEQLGYDLPESPAPSHELRRLLKRERRGALLRSLRERRTFILSQNPVVIT